MNRPPPGTMVWWRFKDKGGEYRFGYCTYVSGYNLVRMGPYNGASYHGPVVDINEIEWKEYTP
jgi:hypothetical protein